MTDRTAQPHTLDGPAPEQAPDDGPDGHVAGILAIAREILARPALSADDDLAAHGANSLSVVRILATALTELGLDIDPREITGAVTARSMAGVAR